jgi:hypothetical protein
MTNRLIPGNGKEDIMLENNIKHSLPPPAITFRLSASPETQQLATIPARRQA